ncbi:MAG: GHKL domain-containing protein [Bacteroidetes bacterium]|nr:GHKL domain-containing protein [Bacteroidota bacterium]
MSFRQRVTFIIGIFVVSALLISWFILRPYYENRVIEERITVMEQYQYYTTASFDRQFEVWTNIAQYLAWVGTNNPQEISVVMRHLIGLRSDVRQFVLTSSTSAGDYLLTSSLTPSFSYTPADSEWYPMKSDLQTAVHLSKDSIGGEIIFGVRKNFTAGNDTFIVTVYANCNPLFNRLRFVPVGDHYISGIFHEQNTIYSYSMGAIIAPAFSTQNISALKKEVINNQTWNIITAEFSSIPFTFIAAFPQEAILAPVQQLFIYSVYFILGLSIIVIILGALFSRQLTKPVYQLVSDVERLRSLDFSHPISPLALPELSRIGTTIESMRTALERYQKLNVEKIIFEEWKNKIFMSHSEDLICLTDAEFKFSFMNDRFERLKNLLAHHAPFETKEDFMRHPLIKYSKQTLRREDSGAFNISYAQMELKIRTSNEEKEFYRLQDVTIQRKEENLGSLLILHDLTNERMIDAMKTEMMNFIVHELRNPLNSVMGFATLMIDDPEMSVEERSEFLHIIEQSSKTMNTLVNRFLDVQRLESHSVEYPKDKVDLSAIARAVCNSQKPQLLAKNLSLNFTVESELPRTVAAPDLLREAFLNLVSNAIKYGDENRTIDVVMKQSAGSILFIITDYGYGISAEDQKKLFSKFYRVSSNKKVQNQLGTGLGLAHVKEVMNYHHGTVTLESNNEIGCRFTLTIPIVHE